MLAVTAVGTVGRRRPGEGLRGRLVDQRSPAPSAAPTSRPASEASPRPARVARGLERRAPDPSGCRARGAADRLAARERPQRPGHPLRRRGPGRHLVARAQDRRSSAGCGSPCSGPSATSASTCPTARSTPTRRSSTRSTWQSIAARERVTRHDVKARIEEFNALAGHEHIHKGMTSRDLTENVEQLQIRASLALVRDRMVADAGPAGAAGRRVRRHW